MSNGETFSVPTTLTGLSDENVIFVVIPAQDTATSRPYDTLGWINGTSSAESAIPSSSHSASQAVSLNNDELIYAGELYVDAQFTDYPHNQELVQTWSDENINPVMPNLLVPIDYETGPTIRPRIEESDTSAPRVPLAVRNNTMPTVSETVYADELYLNAIFKNYSHFEKVMEAYETKHNVSHSVSSSHRNADGEYKMVVLKCIYHVPSVDCPSYMRLNHRIITNVYEITVFKKEHNHERLPMPIDKNGKRIKVPVRVNPDFKASPAKCARRSKSSGRKQRPPLATLNSVMPSVPVNFEDGPSKRARWSECHPPTPSTSMTALNNSMPMEDQVQRTQEYVGENYYYNDPHEDASSQMDLSEALHYIYPDDDL